MFETFDTLLISFYRLTGQSVWDYFLGTFLLALLTVMVGQATIAIVLRFKKDHLRELSDRLVKLDRLSDDAAAMGDRRSYRACNKEATDAYGHLHFNQFGLSAAFLWPTFFALAWMQERFADITIPVPWTGWNANYFAVFLVAYVLARLFFGRTKRVVLSLLNPREKATLSTISA
jgi:hypothetical protein